MMNGTPSIGGMMNSMDSTPNDPMKGFGNLLDQAEAGKMLTSGQMMPGANPPGPGPYSNIPSTMGGGPAPAQTKQSQLSSQQVQNLVAYLKQRTGQGKL
jgi:mono/diheme cytochrome c family protein